jgi:hypothetical protein
MIIYKEPLKVICTNPKSSTKLIKGATYSASCLYINKWGNHDKKVQLKDVGNYNASQFTLLNGNSLENEPEFKLEERKRVDVLHHNYTGQFIKCTWSW